LLPIEHVQISGFGLNGFKFGFFRFQCSGLDFMPGLICKYRFGACASREHQPSDDHPKVIPKFMLSPPDGYENLAETPSKKQFCYERQIASRQVWHRSQSRSRPGQAHVAAARLAIAGPPDRAHVWHMTPRPTSVAPAPLSQLYGSVDECIRPFMLS
jgi:hypothetical protein